MKRNKPFPALRTKSIVAMLLSLAPATIGFQIGAAEPGSNWVIAITPPNPMAGRFGAAILGEVPLHEVMLKTKHNQLRKQPI